MGSNKEKFIFGRFSEKALLSLSLSISRLNLWEGSVSSGKTITSIIRWIEYIKTAPRGRLLMVGKTERTLKRNVLDDLEAIVGSRNFKKKGDGELEIFGRTVDVVGANDQRAEGKIRGTTYAGAYCDEITLYPESFFVMLLSRLRVPGAKLFGTTNPDSPYHWFKQNYIDREDELNEGGKHGISIFHFTMDDNPNLSEDYKNAVKKEYTGLWYLRFILGLWVMASGVIYESFNDETHVIDESEAPKAHDRYYVSIDYGISNPCVFVLVGRSKGKYYLIKEYYHDGRTQGQKTDTYFADRLEEFIEGYDLSDIFLDPSATSFKNELFTRGLSVTLADNAVLDGIRLMASIIEALRFFIVGKDTAPNAKKEFASYIWDEKASKKGEDKPVKLNDHVLDALRYLFFTLEGDPVAGLDDISLDIYEEKLSPADHLKKLLG